MDKQLVSTFMEVTACESQANAVRHLGSCHWNLDEAINLYFSNGGGSTAEPPSGSSADPIILPEEDKDHGDATIDGDNVGAPLYFGDRRIAVDGPFIVEMPLNEIVPTATGWGEEADTDDAGKARVENVDGNKQEAHEDEDAEQDDNMSTKEDDGGSMHGSDGEGYGAYSDDEYEYSNMSYSEEEEEEEDDDDDDAYASLAEDPDGDRPAVQPPPPQKESIEDLFKLPRKLMYHGSFHFAKVDAASKDRFLLVNLQVSAGAGAGDFPSQMQNRDLWADHLVEQVIQGSFVFFLLQMKNSGDSHVDPCMKVASFYKLDVDQLPAVLVLDPITGQLLAKRSGAMMPDEFMHFVDQYTKSNPSAISSMPKFVEKTPPVLPASWGWGDHGADDEVGEQVQKIPMSYAAAVVGACREQEPVPVPNNNNTDELPAEMVDDDDDDDELPAEMVDDDDDDDEPMEDEEMYKLKIRFPDGTTMTKEFGCKRRVASLFAFCRSALHGGEQHAAEEKKKAIWIMRYAGRALVAIQEDDAGGATFEDLGLNFSAVSVVFDAV